MSNIPSKDSVVKQIHEWFDSTDLLRELYKDIKLSKWEEEVYNYFSEIYEDLFANLLLKQTFISSSTKKMLEVLATPIYKKDDIEKEKIYSKIEKV